MKATAPEKNREEEKRKTVVTVYLKAIFKREPVLAFRSSDWSRLTGRQALHTSATAGISICAGQLREDELRLIRLTMALYGYNVIKMWNRVEGEGEGSAHMME